MPPPQPPTNTRSPTLNSEEPQNQTRPILAYIDHPHTTGGPTEAINGRLEHLRGSALGFRNLTHYITRALLETGGFKPQLHPQL